MRADEERAALPPDEASSAVLEELGFGFAGEQDAWLEHLRAAEAPMALGRIGEYELLEEVSRGGQGVVFRARQPGTNRPIALKRLLAGSFATRSMQRRFQREVESAAALNHPGIVTAYGTELVDGQPLFAMEWIDGLTATAWARGAEGEGRDPSAVLECFARICDAIEHAHARGVLHRDLKPSNVLVDESGQPHVLDFGLAKRISQADELGDASELTGSGDFLGTPAYASPEQLRAEWDGLDERTDVYSLGVLLFEMLTGESPYPACKSPSELVRAVETLDPPRPSSLDPRLAREVDTIVRKALSKEREARYAGVALLGEDVRRHLAGRAISALEPSSWYLVRKLVRRNRLASSFAATVLALVVGFAAYALWQAGELEDQRDHAIAGWEEAEANHRLAADAADRMERILHTVTEQLAKGGITLTLPAFAAVGASSPLVPADCPKTKQADRNPGFDAEAFRARQLPVDDPGPPPEIERVGP